jgi:glycine dehydrogenase
MSAFYAIYHGPDGLRKKANYVHSLTVLLAEGLRRSNNQVVNKDYFDTIKIKPSVSLEIIKQKAKEKKINLRYFSDNQHVCFFIE